MVGNIKNNRLLKVKEQKQVGVFKEIELDTGAITLYKVEKGTNDIPNKMNVFGGEENGN